MVKKPPKRELSKSPSSVTTSENKKSKNMNEMEKFSYNKNNMYSVLSDSESVRDTESKYMSVEDSSDTEINKNRVKKELSKLKKQKITENNASSNNNVEKVNMYQPTDKGPFIIIMEKENINDIKTGKRLNELNIKNILNIKQTAKNRLKVQTNDSKTANKILKNVTLSNIDKIKSFLPNSIIMTTGVVRNIDLGMNNEEILNNASCEYKIINVERMMRWDAEIREPVPSTNIKITFRSNKLPDNLKIYFVSRRVDHYILKPLMCKKCLIYGHTKNNCKSSVDLCINCAENQHNEQNCKNKCKFCKIDQHRTGAATCPEEILQKEIKKEMCIKKLTFKEAKLSVAEKHEKQFPELPKKINEKNVSYANVVNANQITEELKRKNILLKVIKEKFNNVINNKELVTTDTILIEIGTLLEKHVPTEKLINTEPHSSSNII